MPHYKCDACRSRLYVPEKHAEPVADLCPDCGSLLVPVTELTELVGFRSITARAGDVVTPQADRHRRIAILVERLVARRASILERQRLDAELWLDDSDEPKAAAVLPPPPQTYA